MRDLLHAPIEYDQTSFPQDAIHPAFRVVSERLEFAIEVGREHDAIREVLLEPFHFGLSFEIQTDIDFSCHAIEIIITPLRCASTIFRFVFGRRHLGSSIPVADCPGPRRMAFGFSAAVVVAAGYPAGVWICP